MDIFDLRYKAIGLVKIRNVVTGELLADTTNAVHLGNLSASMVYALSSNDIGHIRYMAFGNGGTSIDNSGQIRYRQPNVSNIRRTSDSLYNETFKKEILNIPGNETMPVLSNTTYSDIRIVVTLNNIESGIVQNSLDRADAMSIDIDGEFTNVDANQSVFDEIALYSGPAGISTSLTEDPDSLLLTHVVFHPIQKSANRILEIDYTLRIQLT
jgi:hypothetical protein